jgi:hypothetical protein
MLITESIKLRGYIVGNIWWPSGAECWKPLNVDLHREKARVTGDGDMFRYLVGRACADGDFQSATIAQGDITITMSESRNGKRHRVSKTYPLDKFPSVADYVHPDPDWSPSFDDED